MKTIIASVYCLIVCAALLALFYFVAPWCIEHTIASGIILLVLLFSATGAASRTFVGVWLIMPISKCLYKNKTAKGVCQCIFAIALLAGVAIPWIRGIEGFGWKEWAVSIMLTLFIFEELLGFILGIGNIDNDD